jgi:hypothetical protein
MSGDDREAARRLLNALIEDVLSATDDELYAELREDGRDLSAEAAAMRAELDRAAARGRMVLARARVVVPHPKAAGGVGGEEFNGDARKITLAARNGRSQSERDVASTAEDLEAIKAFQAPDQDNT